MPALDKAVIEMSRSSSFLTAITTHLSTIREIVRLQGMLVAEEVSKKSLDPSSPIKPLDFGDIWQEAGPNYTDIRNMKEWLDASKDDSKVADWELPEEEEGVVEEPQDYQQHQHFATPGQDAQSVGNGRKERTSNQSKEPGLIQVLDTSSDFDDYDEIDEPDLEPYALPPKPAAQDLKDIEDLSAYTPEKRKAKPPVYIPDLCAYLKSDDANKLDVGLKEAADLIRRKAQWGTELGMCAIQLPSSDY